MVKMAAQNKVMAAGMQAAMGRQRERQSVSMTLQHNLDTGRFSEKLVGIQNALSAMGMSLVVTPPVVDAAALAKNEAHVERLVEDKKRLLAQIEALQAQIKEITVMPTKSDPWVSLTKAAKALGVSYPTLWRAHKEGRLTTKVIGGKTRDHLVCDPSTFRRKTRG